MDLGRSAVEAEEGFEAVVEVWRTSFWKRGRWRPRLLRSDGASLRVFDEFGDVEAAVRLDEVRSWAVDPRREVTLRVTTLRDGELLVAFRAPSLVIRRRRTRT